MLQVEEQDPDLAFREIAKFGILQVAGRFSVRPSHVSYCIVMSLWLVKQELFLVAGKGKVKVNVDLYCTLS